MKMLIIATVAAAALSVGAALPASAQKRLTAQAVANLDMGAAAELNAEGVRAVQRKLREKAVDPGPIDGIVGPQTIGAVRAFQQRYGMKANGVIDNQLLFALGEAELAIAPTR